MTTHTSTPTRSFEYRADLSETILPEMLYSIDRFQVPGIIEAERDGVVKKVFIKEGNVVHASSSDRGDSLGAYLQRSGTITPEQFRATMVEREGSSKRYGELLIEKGLASPRQIYEGIRKQIEAVVWSLFYWDSGEVRFQIGAFPENPGVRIQLPMRQVILQGIQRAPNTKALVARLGRKETLFEPCFRTEQLIELALDEVQYQVLSLVDGQRTLFELCTQGPLPPAEIAKLLYAFQILRLVRRQGAETRAETRPESRSPSTPSPEEHQRLPGHPAQDDPAEDRQTPAPAPGRSPKAVKIRLPTPGGKFG